MSRTDLAYFTRRTAESRAARIAAVDDGARLAHKQLETAYTALALSSERAAVQPAEAPFMTRPTRNALPEREDERNAAT